MGPHFQRPFSDAIQGNFCSGGSKICVQRTHRPRTDEASSQRFNPAGVTHMNSFPLTLSWIMWCEEGQMLFQ